MADIHFNCPRCQQKLVIDAAGAGIIINCPTCTHMLSVPGWTADRDKAATTKLMPFENPKPAKQTDEPPDPHRKAA